MSIELLTGLLFLSMLVLLAIGVPIVFTMGSIGFIFTIFLWGPQSLYMGASTVAGQITNVVLLAVPLFVLMGNILERTGLADDLYDMMYVWLGPFRGGLAMGTVLICTAFAAMTGITATATVTMGLIALPSMLRRGYGKEIAIGCIAAGGALGVLIPPSVPFVIYALFAGESVGQLFFGGIIPGLILAALFNLYIAIRSYFQPSLCPAIQKEERVSWRIKMVKLRAVFSPFLLIIAVLGSIFFGVATATEAAAVGAFGSILIALGHRRLNWKNLSQACLNTIKLTSMVMWIIVGAAIFVSAYSALGAPKMIQQTVISLEMNRWVIMIGIQLVWLVLGCLLDPIGILMITIPVFLPVIKSLGFNSLWFGVIFIINMEMAFLTPPFGMNLFYMRGVVPEGITTGDIYRSIIPFVGLQALGLALCMIFPQLVLWLPSLMIKTG